MRRCADVQSGRMRIPTHPTVMKQLLSIICLGMAALTATSTQGAASLTLPVLPEAEAGNGKTLLPTQRTASASLPGRSGTPGVCAALKKVIGYIRPYVQLQPHASGFRKRLHAFRPV